MEFIKMMTDEELIAWRRGVVTKMLINGEDIDSILQNVKQAEEFIATGEYRIVSHANNHQFCQKFRPPVVIEEQGKRSIWLLSFNGSNPKEDEAIELTKEQCHWLMNKIANITP